MDLRGWLKERSDVIARRWLGEIRAREGLRDGEEERLVGDFLAHLTSFLPNCLVEHREPGEIIWQQATHLYGSLALRRGLAAGEVVEELQLLRGVILRLLLDHAGGDSPSVPPHMDLLSLNHILDLGVARASVAYVDDLFFTHLQGSGVAEGVNAELIEEIDHQLRTFRQELELSDPSRHERN